MERGWAGHFICAHDCYFRRNTLLEYKNIKIVVSTVGQMLSRFNNVEKFTSIGHNRYYETMVFHAKYVNNRYWDADVCQQISFDSPWAIDILDADDKANDMHEKIVDEIMAKLLKGEKFSSIGS